MDRLDQQDTGVMPGVEEVEWLEDPDWENYQRRSLCRGTRAILLPITSVCPYTIRLRKSLVYDGCHSLQKKNELIYPLGFQRDELESLTPVTGSLPSTLLDLRQHFGFGNAFTCDDVLRIEHLFLFAPATNADSFIEIHAASRFHYRCCRVRRLPQIYNLPIGADNRI